MLQYFRLSYGILQKRGVKEKCSGVCGATMKLLKVSIFVLVVAVGIAIAFVKPVNSQDYSHVNSPPILIVPDRNWRILETEPIGQIISRIRADDAENDVLIFGLELAHKETVNPFRIDPVGGVVYLNQSLAGRGGENFFLYITVTDGQLTAKNEVYVNILSEKKKAGRPRPPTSISNVVHNISHFLPSFGSLPGVQSIRNKQPNKNPSNVLPNGFNNILPSPILNFSSHQQMPERPENENDYHTKTTSLTRLTPITAHAIVIADPTIATKADKINSSTINGSDNIEYKQETKNGNSILRAQIFETNFYGIRTQMIPLLLIACGIFLAAVSVIGFRYRKYLCIFRKKIEKKSKEDMVKKSCQNNLSHSNLTENSRCSIVMQNWNGPIAYGNRYVPWERDQQLEQQQQELSQQSIETSELSTGVTIPGSDCNNTVSLAGIVGAPSSKHRTIAVGDLYLQRENQNVWEFPRHRLKFFNILGEGAFGQVWRCEAIDINGNEGVSTVAVKTLRENATGIEKKDLLSELEVMKSLEPHTNVVQLLGCCTKKDPIFVIIEYVNRGKLQTYLRCSRAERHYGNTHTKSNILSSGDLTSFMYQVAKGMDYLTSRGIIHRDLAARNILIADDHTCKVADFGFARDVITSKVYERKSEGKLPIRWMAIESLYDNIFSIKSDIWSFGILMWEIVTLGSTPYPGVSASDVMRKVRDGYRLEKPDHCRRELYNIMYYCWSQDPNERPSFGDLVKMLDKLLHTEMDYIELERFPDHNYYNILCLNGEKV